MVNFLNHNIIHENSKAKNNKEDEFIRLTHKSNLHREGIKVKRKDSVECIV